MAHNIPDHTNIIYLCQYFNDKKTIKSTGAHPHQIVAIICTFVWSQIHKTCNINAWLTSVFEAFPHFLLLQPRPGSPSVSHTYSSFASTMNSDPWSAVQAICFYCDVFGSFEFLDISVACLWFFQMPSHSSKFIRWCFDLPLALKH